MRCSLLLLLLLPAAVPAGGIEKTDLFEAGKGDYALYRIPGIVVTKKGTLLAYCEARKNAGGDWGHIDILMRRSADDGASWDEARKIVTLEGKFERNPAAVAQKLGKEGEITINNPVAIADADGTVHFLYCVEYARCFYMKSADDGKTFTKPVEITALDALKPAYPWKVMATGPGHGIQLRSGRLLVPVWLSRGTGGHAHRPSVVSSIYSDDHGKTWKAGAIVAEETKPLVNPNETTAVELGDGRVLFNIRSESSEQRRAVASSADGAGGWTKPAFDDYLVEPICMASILRVESKEGPVVLFTNPFNLERKDGKAKPGLPRDRKNLSVSWSVDEAKTWAGTKTLEKGPSAYSDLAARGEMIYCFYERGGSDSTSPYRFLTVARFNIDWLGLTRWDKK
jgi:sialidase-1